jgi:hypothetical protein
MLSSPKFAEPVRPILPEVTDLVLLDTDVASLAFKERLDPGDPVYGRAWWCRS